MNKLHIKCLLCLFIFAFFCFYPKIIRAADYTVIRNFAGGNGDGKNPDYIPTLTNINEKLYGVTCKGGASDRGVVFSINPDGSSFSLLHTFTGGISDGLCPSNQLIESGGV